MKSMAYGLLTGYTGKNNKIGWETFWSTSQLLSLYIYFPYKVKKSLCSL